MEKKVVEIPAELYEKIERKTKELGFESVSEYVVFVLEEVLRSLEEEEKKPDQEYEAKVKKQLKSLGYLD